MKVFKVCGEYVERFDLVEGLWWWCVDHHEGMGSRAYRVQCHLGRWFRPSAVSEGPESHEAREVYHLMCSRSGCCPICEV